MQPTPTTQPNPQDATPLQVSSLTLFIEQQQYKPLTPKELQKGKSYLRIYGTQDAMPWSTIYSRLASGQPIIEVIKQYGHGRKLALWAQEDNVQLNTKSVEALSTAQEARQQIQSIANDDPDTAKTILTRLNELTPDFQGNVAVFADKMIRKATSKLDDKYLEAADMEKLANAVMKTTDLVGVTQRHSAGVNINNTAIKVEGFDFVLDAGPPKALEPLTTDVTDVDALDAVTTTIKDHLSDD